MKLACKKEGENIKTFDDFALIIHGRIITTKKPMIKTSSSIKIKLWRTESNYEGGHTVNF